MRMIDCFSTDFKTPVSSYLIVIFYLRSCLLGRKKWVILCWTSLANPKPTTRSHSPSVNASSALVERGLKVKIHSLENSVFTPRQKAEGVLL